MAKLLSMIRDTVLLFLILGVPMLVGACDSTTSSPSLDSPQRLVSAGGYHTCLLRNTGKVECWGAFGEADKGQARAPTGRFVEISSGYQHSCGIAESGQAVCWGDDSDGQSTVPEGNFTAVDAGLTHTCALRTNGTIACWGSNGSGESDPPVGEFRSIAAGQRHNCALDADGMAACWGENTSGEASPPDARFRSISAGTGTTCGIKTDSTVICWGWAFALQWRKFIGELLPRSEWPLSINGEYTTVSVSDWGTHSCGLRTDGKVRCWGDSRVHLPEDVYVSISAGYHHVCALRADDEVICRGEDEHGQTSPPN